MTEHDEKKVIEDPFLNKVLRCVKENNRTAEEIRKKYIELFPPSFHRIRERLGVSVSVRSIEIALGRLTSANLVKRALTLYTDRPLKRETAVYCLSNKGRSVLLGSNRKS